MELAKAREEYLKHAPFTHTNICRAFFHEELHIPTTQADNVAVLATLMEWIEGGGPLSEHLTECCKTWIDVVSIFGQAFASLAYLHQNHLTHWDIKSDNVTPWMPTAS